MEDDDLFSNSLHFWQVCKDGEIWKELDDKGWILLRRKWSLGGEYSISTWLSKEDITWDK